MYRTEIFFEYLFYNFFLIADLTKHNCSFLFPPNMKLFIKAHSSLFHLCLFLIVALASCSSAYKIQKKTKAYLKEAPEFHQGFSGFMLYDPEEKEVLIEHNSNKYFTPASNTKLFTFYAGLKILKDSVTALEYTVAGDSLIFKGTGDPSFLNPDLPESKVFGFLKNREEDLYYLLPAFKETHFGPGWAWNWYTSYYAVERTAFPLFGNRASFSFEKGKEFPSVKPSSFIDSLDIVTTQFFPRVDRDLYSNRFQFSNLNKDKDFQQNVPLKLSPEIFVKMLSDSLGKEIKIISDAPAKPDKKIYSIPADSLYKRMLVVSDNFIAEQILLLAANELSDTLRTRIAIEHMKKNHLQDLPDEPMWYDGSGLSPYNKFTPRSIVKLLEKLKEEVPQDKLLSMLATGGESGTIKNYYKGEEEPYVFAKTGTLSNVHALSGYLKTKSGKLLIFSFQNNNYVVPTSEIRGGMEKILREIRDHY